MKTTSSDFGVRQFVSIRIETGLGHWGYLGKFLSGSSWLINYPDMALILHWITCINNGDWSNELSMFDGDDLDSGVLTVQLEYFDNT